MVNEKIDLPEGPQKTNAPRVTTAPVTTAIKIRSFSMFVREFIFESKSISNRERQFFLFY